MTPTDIVPPQSPQRRQYPGSPAFNFAVARLEQATIDCAYIFFDQFQHFTERYKTSVRIETLTQERNKMLKWLESNDFQATCELIDKNDEIVRSALIRILHNKKAAQNVADEYGLKIIRRLFASLTLVLLLCLPAFAFPPICLPAAYDPTTEVISLEAINESPVPVKVKGKLYIYKMSTYTYLSSQGGLVYLPFLVCQAKDHAHKHPTLAKIGHFLAPLEPIVSVASGLVNLIVFFRR